MSEPMISVIIPIYRVEKYLSKCLDSVLNQTYKNLEIILVDDGSPDHCGAICDEYAKKDHRIHVIHQENRGVSMARNVGLSAATGEWIGWVDPDDWIAPDMFAYLLEYARETQAEIAVCGRAEVYPDRIVNHAWDRVFKLDTEQAVRFLLQHEQMQNYLWDKLWKRELFDHLQFWERRSFEDIALMHRLFERAKRVVCLPEVKYFYLQHEKSIVGDQSLPNKLNYYAAAQLRLKDMQERWPQFSELLEAQCVASAVGVWFVYWKSPRSVRKALRPTLREIADFAAKHGDSAQKYMKLGITGRIVLKVIPYPTWWGFTIAAICNWVYEQKHGKPL